jgi:hypothetical protein
MKNNIFVFLIFIVFPAFVKAQCVPVAGAVYPGLTCSVSTTGNSFTVSVTPGGSGAFCALTQNVEIIVTLSTTGSGTTITSAASSLGFVTLASGIGTGNLKISGVAGPDNPISWTAGTAVSLATFTLSGTSTGPITAGVSTSVELGGSSKDGNCSSAQISLPLDLLSFQVSTKGKNPELSWLTASEVNVEGFNIERSAEGKFFEKVGTVKSGVTTRGTYTFMDEVPMSGLNYYRLKMMNTDGSFTYSPVRSVTLAESKTTGLSVSPNPAKEAVFVKLNAKEAKTMTLELVDIAGKVLLTEKKKVEAGFNQLSFNLSGYPAGLYFLKVDGVAHRIVIAE